MKIRRRERKEKDVEKKFEPSKKESGEERQSKKSEISNEYMSRKV